jgi:hypothetical protein
MLPSLYDEDISELLGDLFGSFPLLTMANTTDGDVVREIIWGHLERFSLGSRRQK